MEVSSTVGFFDGQNDASEILPELFLSGKPLIGLCRELFMEQHLECKSLD